MSHEVDGRSNRTRGVAIARSSPYAVCAADCPVIQIVLVGAAAGILAGDLKGDRTTTDCDVMEFAPDDHKAAVIEAAKLLASQLQLREDWLNDKVKLFGYVLPLGWRSRLREIGRFGPLHVWAVSRVDLISLKVFSAVKRTRDREDIALLAPTTSEPDFVTENLDRIERECMVPGELDRQRAFIREVLESPP